MPADGTTPGTPGDGPEDLFAPKTQPIDLRAVQGEDGPVRWPVERGPDPTGATPAAGIAGPGVPPAAVPPGPLGTGGPRPAAVQRVGLSRYALLAAALVTLVGGAGSVVLMHKGTAPAAGAEAPTRSAGPSTPAGTTGPAAPTSASGPASVSLSTGPTTAAVTTSAPTTSSPAATSPSSARPTSSTAGRSPARTGSSSTTRASTTTSRTTTTTKPAPVTRSYSINVPASKDLEAGVAVSAGSRVTITATGKAVGGVFTIDSCAGNSEFTPSGNRHLLDTGQSCSPLSYPPDAVLGAAPIGALLARVGTGGWFVVGGSRTVTVAAGGTIAFTFNETKRGDNSGAYSVSYQVTSPA